MCEPKTLAKQCLLRGNNSFKSAQNGSSRHAEHCAFIMITTSQNVKWLCGRFSHYVNKQKKANFLQQSEHEG